MAAETTQEAGAVTPAEGDFGKEFAEMRQKWKSREIKVNDENIPIRFINAEKGDKEKGKERYLLTKKWREDNKVDDILEQSHEDFFKIKQNVCQYYHGHAKDGSVVYYEVPKVAKLSVLKEQKLTSDKILRHYVHSSEFCWQILDPRELEGRSVNVMDAKGVGVSDLIGEVRTFMQEIMGQSQQHYPERANLTLIINAPWTFTGVWSLVKGWIDPATVAKTKIVGSKDTLKTLLQYIDIEQIPRQYGGKCSCIDPATGKPGPNACRFHSKQEQLLTKMVKYNNERCQKVEKDSTA